MYRTPAELAANLAIKKRCKTPPAGAGNCKPPESGAANCIGKLGLVAHALWPRKPAEHIAARTGSSLRAVKYRMAGRYDITARDIKAIIDELLGD